MYRPRRPAFPLTRQVKAKPAQVTERASASDAVRLFFVVEVGGRVDLLDVVEILKGVRRYYEDFQDFMAMGPEQLEVLNVVNIRRPLAGTVEKIIDLQEQMQIHSHLKITGMINNTNLATMTTPAELRDGYEMLREVSDRTGVPVMYTTGKKEMLDIFLAEGHDPKYIGKPVPIDIIMKRDWDSYIHSLSEKKQA